MQLLIVPVCSIRVSQHQNLYLFPWSPVSSVWAHPPTEQPHTLTESTSTLINQHSRCPVPFSSSPIDFQLSLLRASSLSEWVEVRYQNERVQPFKLTSKSPKITQVEYHLLPSVIKSKPSPSVVVRIMRKSTLGPPMGIP